MTKNNFLHWTNNKNPPIDKFVEMFGVPKVILIKGTYTYPLNDFDGKYAVSNYSFGIPITSKKQGDDIVKVINGDHFNEIIQATKWNSGFTDHNMFKYFKPDFYKYFLDKQPAGLKIKQFITKKYREKHNVTKKSKGGRKKTVKNRSFFYPFV